MGSECYKLVELSTLLKEPPRNGLYKSKEFQGSGHRWIKMSSIFGSDFFLSHETELLRVTESELRRFSCEPGDLLFGRTSLVLDGVGKCLLVGDVTDSPVFESNLFRLRFNSEKAYSLFYFYFFKSSYGRELIQKIAKQTAAASITASDLVAQPVPYPSFLTQKKIGDLLFSFEKKIELNRQMNTTLEAMAQALFKSWFVDFDPVIDNALAGNEIPPELAAHAARRAQAAQQTSSEQTHTLPAAIRQQFPDCFVFTDTMGWVPEGWEPLDLSSAIQINPKVTLRKGHVAKYADMKALPTSGYGIDQFEWKAYAGGAKFLNNDVLLARITPCLENGKTGLVDFLEGNEPGFGSTEFIVMRGKGAISSPYVACLARDANFRLHCVTSMVGSSGRQRVQNACFDSYFVSVPQDETVLKLFDAQCSPTFKKMTALNHETARLASVRDTLLPKLLSGQLRIPEAEQLVAEVI